MPHTPVTGGRSAHLRTRSLAVTASSSAVFPPSAASPPAGSPNKGAAGDNGKDRAGLYRRSSMGGVVSEQQKEKHSTGVECAGCQNALRGQYIAALGASWHAECFVCTHCKQSLATGDKVGFHEKDGRPYCKKHYVSLFAPVCAACSRPIVDGPVLKILDKTYHPDHLVCCICKTKLSGSKKVCEKDGKMYCQEDFMELYAAKCYQCKKGIVGEVVSAGGKQFHPEHFTCKVCKVCLGTLGKYFEKDGHFFCEKDYKATCGPRCAICMRVINGEGVSAFGKMYHPEHFVCVHCKKPIPKGSAYGERNGNIYCKEDFAQLFCEPCGECGAPVAEGQVVRALGRHWHANHFRCCFCKKVIGPEGQYHKVKDKASCSECYVAKCSPLCCICDKNVGKVYSTNFWGDVYCRAHNKEYPMCNSCGRLVAPGTGGNDFPDGRAACGHCCKNAVTDDRVARKLFEKVKADISRLGLDIPDQDFPLKLMDRASLRALAQKQCTAHSAVPWGMTAATESQTTTTGAGGSGTVITRGIQFVAVLHSLPKQHAMAVMAHELAHVYFLLSGYPRFSPQIEEGLCELVKYLYIRPLQTPESRFILHLMETNEDPVYGKGFRDVRAALDRAGSLQGLMRHVRRHRRLP